MSTNNDNLISIKELAAKLKVTDALVKKLIKDFGIEPDRVQKRIHLNEDAVKTVREILALKASGKKNKEIKELFDAAQAELKTETKAVPEESKEEPKAKKEEKTISKKASPKKPKTDSKTETGSEDKPEAEVKTETKSKNPRTRKKPKAKTEELKTTKEEAPVKKEKEEDGLDITSYLDETEDDEISMAMRLADNDSPIDEEPKAEIDLDEALDLDEGEADFEELPEVVEKTGKRLNPRKMRRRQFSFRYIQRQIANDAKRVQYIQQKLERGRLSTMEEMNLKDSLEHRSKLHSGWVHLLKWVKS